MKTEFEVSLACQITDMEPEAAEDYLADIFDQLQYNNLIVIPDTIQLEVRSEED